MIQTTLKIIFFVSLFTACSSEEDHSTTGLPDSGRVSKKNTLMDCYQYASPADTIKLKLIHIGEAITGILIYKLDGKDKNEGTIQGSMKGDLLLARYTFRSEGVTSVRPVAFRLKENTFVEGYGETTGENEKVQFTNSDSLKFNDSMKLIEIPCH